MSPASVAENLSADPQEPPASATTTRLRLAFVIDVIQDWHAGGTEQQMVQILNRLDSRHFEPAVFVLQPSEALQKKPVNCPVLLIGPTGNSRGSRLRTLLDLTRAIRAFRPHILQTFF